MVKIDIDELTEAELIDLNHRIVERLRFLSQMRAHESMLQFKIGDRVTFQSEGQPSVAGMLVRCNKKTVTSLPIPASTGTSIRAFCADRNRPKVRTRSKGI